MADSKHTPGPWKLDIRSGCAAVYPESEEHRCLSFAHEWAIHYVEGFRSYTGVVSLWDSIRGHGIDWMYDIDPVKIANARLMAASPGLLTACRTVLADIVADIESQEPSPRIYHNWKNKLDAAIAKAEVTDNECL